MRNPAEVNWALALVTAGHSDCEASRRTGIPRTTIRDWRNGKVPSRRLDFPCGDGESPAPPEGPYAYLLGMYLGDGCISKSRSRGVWRLRIVADIRYPRIIEECATTMEAVLPPKRAHRLYRKDSKCVEISMYSKLWPWLFPQHGPGRKHLRRIELVDWQKRIVGQHPEPLLRGLIHSDGCRFVAKECQRGRVRLATRYVFSNRSEDIKDIFCESCDSLGIRWTRPNAKSIAIYRADSVARLDRFVGPKQ